MTFGYALRGAPVLLPGFSGRYGVRIGEANDLVSPRPDHPNSKQTIFLAMAFCAHVVGAVLSPPPTNRGVPRGTPPPPRPGSTSALPGSAAAKMVDRKCHQRHDRAMGNAISPRGDRLKYRVLLLRGTRLACAQHDLT